jgi:serine/threonine protein kinase
MPKLLRFSYSFLLGSAYDLLEQMLNYNPDQRTTCTQALSNQYFKTKPEPQRKYGPIRDE